MRVVVAPDSFGGTLSAPDAADAIAAGWRRAAPSDDVRVVPLADGGTGFADVLHAVLRGTLHETTVTGPLGAPVPGTWLHAGDTAYVEAATACGLHHVPREQRTPATARAATSRGVGELLAAACDAGARRIVVGLGGSATTDGGAGMLAALGAVPCDASGAPLPDGGAALARCAALNGSPALHGVELIAAADVDNPLLGRHGAAAVFGPQKGADQDTVAELDAALTVFADVLERVRASSPALDDHPADDRPAGAAPANERDVRSTDPDERHVRPPSGSARAVAPADECDVRSSDPNEGDARSGGAARGGGVAGLAAAGAAGGLGAALLALGARVEPGAGLVRRLTGLDAELDAAAAGGGLAVTGEGSFDWQSLRGKLVTAVAGGAAERGMPCVVLAGQVSVGRREMGAAGVDAAYAVADSAGLEASLADPAGTLSALAEQVARRWSR